ncbi:MAG: hypothetical protein KG012_09365 [Deltaproteobacteria bacterium]|nr:hypothetical protein [Deltaproteobacteria bacterium]
MSLTNDDTIKDFQIVDFPEELKAQVSAVILTAFFREKENGRGQQSE